MLLTFSLSGLLTFNDQLTFNPNVLSRIDASASPLPGSSSMDKYEVGDLSGKYGTLKTKNEALESHVDPNLR